VGRRPANRGIRPQAALRACAAGGSDFAKDTSLQSSIPVIATGHSALGYLNAKAGHSQDRPSYHGWIVEHGIGPDATSGARSETPPMNTRPTIDAAQLALALAHLKLCVRDRPALQKPQKPLVPSLVCPCFEQLGFQSAQATRLPPFREPLSGIFGKALAPVQ
jgi:hypothetical protein